MKNRHSPVPYEKGWRFLFVKHRDGIFGFISMNIIENLKYRKNTSQKIFYRKKSSQKIKYRKKSSQKIKNRKKYSQKFFLRKLSFNGIIFPRKAQKKWAATHFF